ncbi:MAG: sensor histidine kinase [Ruminococcus sp.]|nr:sensor histidine kinase [Ruminococcus sp.]
MKSLCYVIWAVFSNLPMFIGLHLNLDARIKNKWLRYVPMMIQCIVYMVVAFILTTENNIMRMFFFMAYLVYAVAAFSNKPSKSLVVASALGALSFAVDLIVELPVFILKGKVLTPSDGTWETALVCIVFGLLYMVTIIVYTRFNKKNESIVDKTSVLFFMLPLSNMFLILAVASAFNAPDFWNPLRSTMLAMGIFVMLVSLVLLYKAMKENYRAKQSQMKLAQLEYNQKLSESYFENVTQSAQMLMKYKHDFNNMITTALHMVNSEDDSTKQQGVKLLEEIRDKNKATAIPLYCKNPVVNTILFDKSAKAQAEDVELSIEAKLPEKIDIELTDICSVYTNLIDNGIRSASVSEDNRLELKTWCDMGYLFVKTRNYPDDTQLPEVNNSFDIKNISSHGYGLSILEDMAEKYGGSFEINKQGNAVEMMCCMKTAQAEE